MSGPVNAEIFNNLMAPVVVKLAKIDIVGADQITALAQWLNEEKCPGCVLCIQITQYFPELVQLKDKVSEVRFTFDTGLQTKSDDESTKDEYDEVAVLNKSNNESDDANNTNNKGNDENKDQDNVENQDIDISPIITIIETLYSPNKRHLYNSEYVYIDAKPVECSFTYHHFLRVKHELRARSIIVPVGFWGDEGRFYGFDLDKGADMWMDNYYNYLPPLD